MPPFHLRIAKTNPVLAVVENCIGTVMARDNIGKEEKREIKYRNLNGIII